MKRVVLLAMLLTALAGCASSTKVQKDLEERAAVDGRNYSYSIPELGNATEDAPPHFVAAVKSYLEQDLRQRAMLPGEGIAADREVRITLTAYRMRSGFTRTMFGVFAGKDGVESTVTVVDVASGAVLGGSSVSSFNVMAVGEQEDIARMHAKEIGKFLAGEGKRKN